MNYPSLTFLLLSTLLITSSLACRWFRPDPFEGPCSLDSNVTPVDCNFYGTVCAFFEGEDCEGGLCQRYIEADACTACSDPSVHSYRQEPCTGEKVFCDPNYRPENCYDINFDPVCAYIADCEGDNCRENIRNPCNACRDPTVEYYVRGRCLDSFEEKTHCNSNSQPDACDQIIEPVCAYQRDCSDHYNNPSCARTFKNGCLACNDPSFEFYVPGECPNEKNFCDPDNRPIREETPIDSCQPSVCIYLSDCEGDNCTEYDFLPVACANPLAEYYILGGCLE